MDCILFIKLSKLLLLILDQFCRHDCYCDHEHEHEYEYERGFHDDLLFSVTNHLCHLYYNSAFYYQDLSSLPLYLNILLSKTLAIILRYLKF